MFSQGSSFCADSYFGIPFPSVLLQLHVKDPGHFAKSAGGMWHRRNKVTQKTGVWRTQNVRRDGSSFMWHQSCNNQKAL